jgi:hypothetical protein
VSKFEFNNPPINPGEMGTIDETTGQPRQLTEEEKRQLEGKETKQEEAQEDSNEVLPDYQPTGLESLPNPVDISALDPAKQREIMESLEKANKTLHETEKAKPDTTGGLSSQGLIDDFDADDPFPEVEITEKMKENYLRSCMSGNPFTREFTNDQNTMRVRFRTLTIQEWDAIRDALDIMSQKKMFVSVAQVTVMNFRLSVATSLERLYLDNTQFEGQVVDYHFPSPLKDFPDAEYTGEYADISKEDGKPIATPMTDGHRILLANEQRFSGVNSVLYNLLLNLYKRFDVEVMKLNQELEKELNFSAAAFT